MGSTSSSPLRYTTKSPLRCKASNDKAHEKSQETFATQPSQLEQVLNERQASVLMKMNIEAMKLSTLGEKELLSRLTKAKLKKIASYIQHRSDIIVHLFLDKLIEDFMKDEDGRYKNLFETGKGNGSNCQLTRKRWEDRLFFDGYSDAEPYERVKYGCLNIGNDASGVASAYQYGDSFFILNNDTVRWRATLSDGDTANPKRAVGTFSACYHVIQKFTDDELNNIYKKADPTINELTSMIDEPEVGELNDNFNEYGEIFTMKEVQVHGILRFKEDIKILVVSKRHTTPNFLESSGNRSASSEISRTSRDSSSSFDQSLLDKTRKFCEFYDIELKLQE